MMTDEERRNKGAESVPLQPTWSPGVLPLLHFHMRQHFDKTVQEQPDTGWPTYKNHYHLSKHCYFQQGWVLIKSCEANELWSLTHWVHVSAMNDRSERPVEEHWNKMADMSMWATHVILMCWILSPGAQFVHTVQLCGPLMGPRWSTLGLWEPFTAPFLWLTELTLATTD